MTASTRWTATFAIAAMLVPAHAEATPFGDAAETAVFTLCSEFRAGQIRSGHHDRLRRLGYRRARTVEADWTDAEDGRPLVFTRSLGTDNISIAYWGFPRLCRVILDGDAGEAAIAQIRARIDPQAQHYRRVEGAQWGTANEQHESWQVAQDETLCLGIDSLIDEMDRARYEISIEPLPPLHPSLIRSACAPPPD